MPIVGGCVRSHQVQAAVPNMPGRTAKNFRPFGRMTKENQFTLFWCAVQALFLGPRSFTSCTRKKRLGGSTLYNLVGRKSRVGVNASFKCERLNSPAKRGSGLRAPMPSSSEISTSTSALREHVTRYTCERVTETQREEEIGARQSSALMRR